MFCIKQSSCLEHFVLQVLSRKGALKRSGESQSREEVLRGLYNFCGFRAFRWKGKCDPRMYRLKYFQQRYTGKQKA